MRQHTSTVTPKSISIGQACDRILNARFPFFDETLSGLDCIAGKFECTSPSAVSPKLDAPTSDLFAELEAEEEAQRFSSVLSRPHGRSSRQLNLWTWDCDDETAITGYLPLSTADKSALAQHAELLKRISFDMLPREREVVVNEFKRTLGWMPALNGPNANRQISAQRYRASDGIRAELCKAMSDGEVDVQKTTLPGLDLVDVLSLDQWLGLSNCAESKAKAVSESKLLSDEKAVANECKTKNGSKPAIKQKGGRDWGKYPDDDAVIKKWLEYAVQRVPKWTLRTAEDVGISKVRIRQIVRPNTRKEEVARLRILASCNRKSS